MKTTPKPITSTVLFYLLFIFSLLFATSYGTTAFADEWVYTTRPGDNLWNISQKYLKSPTYWQRVQKHNEVDVAKQLAPGTRLRMPIEWLKTPAASAVVVSVTGDVEYKASNKPTGAALLSKQSLQVGDSINTSNTGNALIQFADGSTLLIQKNSRVIFDSLSSYGETGMVDTRLRLQQGRVETTVTPVQDTGSRFEITTPAAIAAVRGTQFRMSYQETQKSMSNEVVQGQVSVAAEAVEQPVNKGFGTIAEQGKAPLPPIKLLDAPQLDKLATKIRTLPHTFSWPSLNKAEQYRIQLAPAAEPEQLQQDDTQTNTDLTLGNIKDGHYSLRIRGIDNIGLEGFNAEHTFEINTDFPVVKLSQSEHEITLSEKPYVFSWVPEKNISQYQIQIATNDSFKYPVINRLEKTTSITLDDELGSGDYYWRVAAVDNEGNIGTYSEVAEFTIAGRGYSAWMLLLYLLPAFIL